MTLITCTTPNRHFWGAFNNQTDALRTLFEALVTAFPDDPPETMSVMYCPVVGGTLPGPVGALFEEVRQ